jgi:hypothetical protein
MVGLEYSNDSGICRRNTSYSFTHSLSLRILNKNDVGKQKVEKENRAISKQL